MIIILPATLKSTEKCDATGLNESITDLVNHSQMGLCENIIANHAPENVTSETNFSAERTISISVGENENSNKLTRRHSSRIQRNREREEAQRVTVEQQDNDTIEKGKRCIRHCIGLFVFIDLISRVNCKLKY